IQCGLAPQGQRHRSNLRSESKPPGRLSGYRRLCPKRDVLPSWTRFQATRPPACRRCWASRPPECHCGTPALSPAAIASLVPQQESAADRVERVVVLASATAGEGERELGAVLAPPLR